MIQQSLKTLAHNVMYKNDTNATIKIEGIKPQFPGILLPLVEISRDVYSAQNRFVYKFAYFDVDPAFLVTRSRTPISLAESNSIVNTWMTKEVPQLVKLIQTLARFLRVQISEMSFSEEAAPLDRKSFFVQCAANEVNRLGDVRLWTQRVFDMRGAASPADWLRSGSIIQEPFEISFIFDTDTFSENFAPMSLMAQYIVGEYLKHDRNDIRRVQSECREYPTKNCFNHNTALSASFLTVQRNLLRNSMLFTDSEDDPFNNDDMALFRVAAKVTKKLYGQSAFFDTDWIVSPNLHEPFPVGTTLKDVKQPYTNPPVLRRAVEVPVTTRRTAVDREFEAMVMQKMRFAERGLVPMSEVEPGIRELRAQQTAAGETPIRLARPLATKSRITASMGGKRKTSRRSRTPLRKPRVRKTVRRSLSKSKSKRKHV